MFGQIWRALQLTWLLVTDIDIQSHNNDICKKGSCPVDDKHHPTAENGSSKGNPHVVVFEARSPACNIDVN